MKRIIIVITLAATLVLAVSATATAADWPDNRLDAVSSAVAGHSVHVYCEDDQGSWNDYFYGQGEAP